MLPLRSPLRRAAVATITLPLWIVMILTGGQWCLMPSSVEAREVIASELVASSRAEAQPAGGHHHANSSTASFALVRSASHSASHSDQVGIPRAHDDASHASVTPSPSPASEGTQHHGRSGGACESQAACSVAVTPAALQLTEDGLVPPTRPVPAHADRLVSLSYAPELPPPRA